MEQLKVDYKFNFEDFKTMENIEHSYFPNDNITPAEEVLKWYEKNDLTCVGVRNEKKEIIASVSILPLKKHAFMNIYENKMNEADVVSEQIEEYQDNKAYYIYLASISIDERYRNSYRVITTLLKGCIDLFDSLIKRNIKIKKVMADASTIHGKKICTKLLNMNYITHTSHNSKIYCIDGNEFIETINKIKRKRVMETKKQDNKIIIFDWGGVVESHREGDYNIYEARINLIKRFNNLIDEKELLRKYKDCYYELNIRACKIPEDIQKWFNRIKRDLQLNCNFEEFCEAYKEEYSKVYYYKEVVDFAHSLREYCKTGILSNLIFLDKTRIDHQMNLDKFDYVWLSFEIEAGKPDEKIYKFVEKECKISPENILFIDDKEINIVVASQRGWNVCHARGYELDKIKESVYKFLND